MSEFVHVAVDAMGGDHAPAEIVKGTMDALNKCPNLKVTLTGPEDLVKAELSKHQYPQDRVQILNCTEVIAMAEPPVEAIRTKKDSSIVVGMKLLREKEAQAEEIKRLQERLKKSAEKGEAMSSDEFSLPMSDEERARAMDKRRKGMMADLDRDLNNARSKGAADIGAVADIQDSIAGKAAQERGVKMEENAVRELSDDAENNIVVKKSKDDSEYFNTLSHNEKNSNLIKAIIDEEIKAVEGSRVRLRLLDDIEINGTLLTKGSYLFATMSGFGQQRVKGKVESVLIGDEILKIGLSIYDTTDGLEGLYVPESSFRETAKDIGSSAMQSNMNMNTMGNGNSLTQWAGTALQNAYQRTSNAVSKAIKKNKVRIKYGTQVYLVNSKKEKKR